MTNPATDLKTADTVFVVTTSHLTDRPVDFIVDAMSSYDSDLYRREIAAGRLDDLVEEEWENVWTEGDDSWATEAEAEAYRDGPDTVENERIVEISKWQVREALLRNFGEPEA